MATTLSVGDVAVVHYNSSTGAFTFAFLRDVEAGTEVHFTDNGWLASGGFRPGEGTVTYTAPSAITAGTIVTLTGLDLDPAGDQIIAYQGDPLTPTILHLIDFGDGNNTVAGDATDDNTTALPPGFTLGVNAVAVAFDASLYAGPVLSSPEVLFATLNNSANWLDDDSLPVPFVFDARPLLDLDPDNSSGANGRDYLGFVQSGGPAVPISDVDVDIDDFDDFDLLAAEITIMRARPGDLLAINGSLPFGIVATAYNPITGVLRLDGLGSHDDYEAAIRQIVFSTQDTPGAPKFIKVSVYDGWSWSYDSTAVIRIQNGPIAVPPEIDLDANNSTGFGADASATYEAGGAGAPVVDIDVLITDEGGTTIQSATINILDYSLHAGDTLSISGTLPAGITASSYNPFSGVITLSGAASLADYQAALRQVVFSNTLSTPSTFNRDIQVSVNDGSLDSNFATMHMHVVIPPPNDTPGLDLDFNNSTTSGTGYLTGFTEAGSPVAVVDADVRIIDADDPNFASATITLTNPDFNDFLTFVGTPPPGILVSGAFSTTITLTGVASQLDYELALKQIRFNNDSADPSNVTRTIEIVVNDGTINSNIATALVQVESVNNSAPAVDLDPDDSTASTRSTFRTIFTENGPPTSIADTDTTITDIDSTTLVSATITLVNQTSFDVLSVTLPLPGGIVASAYDPATGVLTLSGTATLDDYEVALQQILYSNDNDNPDTQERLVEVVVSDGVNTSNVAAAVITVVTTNDAPEIENEGTIYVEDAGPVVLDPIVALSDPDSAELDQVVIRISTGAKATDRLTINGGTGGNINGILFIYEGGDHAMVMTGRSSLQNYQDLLRTLAFETIDDDNPTDYGTNAIRILTWTVSDGDATTTTTTTLDILPVNDAPQATVAATAAYTENAQPVVLSPASTATDVDNLTLISGEVRIVAGAVDGDLLTVNGLQSGTFAGIEFSYDPLLHSLRFTHPSLVADYQAFLQAVAFSSTSENPTNFGLDPTRTLSWYVYDGAALSDVHTTVVTITALADAPVNTVPGAQSVNEDTLLPIAGVSVTDSDVGPLITTLAVTSGILNVTAGAGVTGNGTATVTITGTADEINAALAGLSYIGNLDFNGSDTLTITTSDDIGQDVDTIAITVNAVNDAPVHTVPGPQSVNEDTTLPLAVSVADVDSPSLATTLTVTSGTLNVTAGAGVSGNGTGSVTIIGTVAEINAALAGLSYTGNLDFNGSDTLTVTTTGGTAQDIDTVAITVNAVNDAPVNTVPGAQSVNEDATLPIAGVSVADVDGPALTTTLTVTSGTLNVTAGAGVSGNGTATVTITGTAAEINTALAGLTYTGTLNFNGSDTLTVTTGDGTAQDIDTVAITVNPVNDAPVNTVPGAQTVNEDVALPIAGVSVADVDGGTLTTTLTVTSGTLSVTAGPGVSGNGTGSVAITGTVAEINAALAGLTYTGNLDFNGADTLTVTTGDGTTQDVDTVAITVNPVADAPVNTVPVAQTVNEDTTLPIAGVSVADADGGTLTTTLTVTSGALNVTAGTGVTGNGTAAVTITGTAAEINAALAGLTYTGNLDFNGSDTLTVTTSDGALTDIDTVAITVNPVNDAPVNTVPGPQTANEDTALPIAGVSVTDVDGGTLTTTLTVTSGTLSVTAGPGVSGNGTGSVAITGTAAQINAALAGLSYTGNLDFNGSDTLTVTTGDGTTQDIDTVAITVSALNDAPVNTVPAAQSVNEDVALPIAGVSVADVDSGALTTTLTVTSGTLNVTAGAGVTGNGTATVTITGTAAEINTALAGLSYTGNLDFNGSDTLTVTTGDGTAQDVDTVAITVNAVNDAPVNTVPVAQSVNEDTTLPIAGVSVADVDGGTLTTTLTVTNGIVNVTAGAGVTGNGTAAVTITGTVAEINAALAGLTYTGNLNFNGSDTLTVTTGDGTTQDIDTIAISVDPVADAPVNAVPAAQIAQEDTPLLIPGLSVTDVDTPTLTVTLSVLNGSVAVVPGLALVAGNLSATATISGTLAEVNLALASVYYLGNPDFTGPDTLTMTSSDGALSDVDTVAITVAAVADAPVLDLDADNSSTAPGSGFLTTFTEDGAAAALADIDLVLNDADSPDLVGATFVLLNARPGDVLVVTGSLPLGISVDFTGNTLTLSGTASVTDYRAALALIAFDNPGDAPDPQGRLIQVTVDDGTSTTSAFALVQITALNDAPLNTVPAAQSVNEDTLLPIAGVSVADVDSGVLTTTLTVTSGTLNVTAGAGVSGNGTAAVTITGSAAEINAALAGLSYTGNLNFNGSDTLTVTTSDGTAQDIDTIAITVNPVDDAPVNTVPAAQSVNEDTALPIAGVSVADPDVGPLTTTLTVTNGILNVTAGAGVTGNGTATVTITGTAAEINTALAGLTYTGTLNFNGSDTLTVTTGDGTAQDIDTVAITVNPVNDAPVNTVPGAQTVNEDVALTIAGVSVADVDGGTLTTTLTVTSGTLSVTAGPGVSGNGTGSVAITGTVAEINAALAGLTYTGNLDFNGSDTLTVTTGDGTTQDVDTVAITVNPVADAPVNTVPVAQTVNEDTTLPIPGVSVADAEGGTLSTTLMVTSGALNVTAGAGVSGNGTAAVTITGTAAEINAVLAGLTYTGNLDFNGSDTLTVTTSDGALTDIDTVAITVNPVNDAPVNTVPGPQTANEDTALPIAGVSVTDVDGGTLTTTLTVTSGTLSVTAGPGVSGNGTGSVAITGTAAQINAALAGLSYTGNLDFNGSDTLTVTTGDGTTQDIDTVAITVSALNDAPVNTVPAAQSVNEDATLPIAGVSVADVDSGALTTTLTVTSGTLNVTAGAGVTGNGTATVTITGTAAEINTALAGLSYTGNLDFNGSDTLTVTTGDGTAQDVDTVAITVNAVNDAPVNTVPVAQSVNEDTTLPIAGVSVADVDGGTLTTTLTVTNGIVNVTAGAGVTGNGTAAVTITGTVAEINAALAGLTYTGNLNFNGSDTLTVTTGDGTTQDIDTIAISVDPVADAPVNAVPAAQIAQEDTPLLIPGLSVTDVDTPTLTVTLSVLNGSVAVVPGLALVAGNLSATATISGTLAEVNLALASVYYLGNPDFTGPDTLTMTSSDGALSDVDTVAITVAAVADAPVLDLDADNSSTAPGSGFLTTFTEDGAAAALADLDLVLNDADSPDLVGATFVLLNARPGDVLVVTGSLPLGISVDFTGNTLTLSGTASVTDYRAALALIAFDNPGDAPDPQGRLIQVTVDDGTSTTSAFALVQITALNDAPLNTVPAAQSVNEDVALPIAGVSVADVDSGALTTTLTVTSGTLNVTAGAGVSGNGTAAVTITGSAAEINAALAGLSYTGNLNFNGSDTLTVTTSDGTAQDIDTIAITVNPVDDAPVNTVPAAQSVNEDVALPIAGVSVADPDVGPLTTTLTVTNGILNVTAGTGVTGNGTATVTITGTAAEINTALAGLTYTGTLNFNGSDTLTVTTSDGTAQDIDTIAITVNPVADAPVNTVPGAQTVNEDTLLPIAGVSVADADGGPLTTTLTVTNGILNVTAGTGVTGNGTATVTITGTAAEINTALAGLSYTGNLDFNGSDTLTVTTGDGAAQDIDTIAITVNPVADAPVNTVPGTQTVNEDTLLPISGVSVADADGGTLTTTLTVTSGTLNVTAGTGITGNGTAAVTITGTAAEINAALAGLSYTGNLEFNGSDTLTVTTSDGTAQDIDTIAITVNPMADPPVNTVPGAQTVNEDTLLPIVGVSVADPDVGPLTTTLVVTSGTLNVTAGAGVSGNGTATVTITGTATAINTALAGLSYTGNLDFNGSDTLTVTTGDGAAQDIDTIAITVNPVADAPVNTVPGAQSVNEDATLPIAGVSVADGDGGALTTTLVVTSGTLNVTAGAGVTGNGTATVTITGTATAINTALAGLTYTGNLDFNGSDTLTVTTSDGALADIDTVAITVGPVADAPVNTVPGAQTVNEDTTLAIAGVSVADPDIGSITTTLAVTGGTLNVTAGTGVTGNGTATVTITGTAAEINTALAGLSYTGNLDFNGSDTLTVTTNDGTAQDVDTIAITVNPVADAPVNTVPGAQTIAEDTTQPIAGVSVADPDVGPLTTTLTVTSGTLNVTAGAGVTGNGTATVTITGTAAEINAALAGLTYTGNLDFIGPDTLTVTTSDGAAQDVDTIAITVNPVTNAPVNTVPVAQSVNEDVTLPIAGVSVADADSGALTTTLTVTSGTLNVTAGAGVIGNGTATVTITGTVAEINTALAGLSYTGNLDFNGSDTLTVTTDDGSTQDVDTVAITVNPVNDAPTATVPSGLSVNEDTALLIPGVLVADVDSPTLVTFVEVTHGILNVTTGTGALIAGNGSPTVRILGTVAQTNAALAGLSYLGFLNFQGQDTLTVTTRDETLTRESSQLIDVLAVNDAPVNTVPGAQTVNEDATLPIAGVSVADPDVGPLTTTLTVTNGIVNVTAGAGVTGNGTAAVTISGTAAEINAALAGLAYTGNLNFNGPDTLTVTTGDGTTQDVDAIAITVNPVNDQPVLDLDANNSSGAAGFDYTTIFIPGGAAAAVADVDNLITDADNPNLASATITLVNHQTDDLLSIIGALPAGITASTYDPATGVLTLSGPTARAFYQTALRQVAFSNSGATPSTTDRIVNVVVNDGSTDSNVATSLIQVALSAPPTLDLDGDDSTSSGTDYAATFTEGAAGVPVADTDVVIGGSTLALATITLTNLQAGDRLFVAGTLPPGITEAYNPVTGVLTLTGGAPAATFRAVAQQVLYTNDSDNPPPGDRVITVVVNDGITDSNTAVSTIHIAAVNNAPVNAVPPTQEIEANTDTPIAGLAVADTDAGSGTMTTTLAVAHGALTVAASGAAVSGGGTGTVVLTGTLATINATLASVVYRGAQDYFGTDALTVTTDDGGSSGAGGALTDTDQVIINLNTHLIGTPNDDSFAALPGNERIDALDSIDTITFGFRLVDATVTYVGNQVIIDGPGSHTVLTGFETYVFTDGTVFNYDGDWLVDDLFYYSRHHDVWTAHVEADSHYHGIGWHEGRDPSAFFSTPIYLSAYPDVKASGGDPLVHFHEFGWVEQRIPSLTFDPRQYLEHYPDVAAAQIDPLEHFLRIGAAEGRQPFAPTSLPAVNGVDYVYYLQQYPDVAAAGIDPYEHYNATGWKEGRNPNAFFDTAGYLSHYTDVAAAGINPLQHYELAGWHEGRDPSLAFDTLQYLAAYPDVATADISPLSHFLQFGVYEGRSPFGDGTWH